MLTVSMLASHNPYFNRWFSAITYIKGETGKEIDVTILILIDGFLQSLETEDFISLKQCHNPYFNRWFSAITRLDYTKKGIKVTILILIDGFLQWL